jgi:hypothetical protein
MDADRRRQAVVPETKSSELLAALEYSYEHLKGLLPEEFHGPTGVAGSPDNVKGSYAGGASMACNFLFGTLGLFEAADSKASAYERVQGGLGFLTSSLEGVASAINAGAAVTDGAAAFYAGAAMTASAILSLPAAAMGTFAFIGGPKYEGWQQLEADGHRWGERLGFSAALLGDDVTHARNTFLAPFDDQFGDETGVSLYKHAFRDSFVAGWNKGASLSPDAKQELQLEIFPAVAAQHAYVGDSSEEFVSLVFAVARATSQTFDAALTGDVGDDAPGDADHTVHAAPTEGAAGASPDDGGMSYPDSTVTPTPDDGGVSYPDDSTTTSTPDDGGMSYPDDSTTSTPDDGGMSYPDDSTTSTPDDGAISYPDDTTTTPDDAGISYPDDSTTSTPDDGAISYPDDTATTTPDDGAISYPDDPDADGGLSYPDEASIGAMPDDQQLSYPDDSAAAPAGNADTADGGGDPGYDDAGQQDVPADGGDGVAGS